MCVTWIIDYVCSSEESSVCVTWIIDYVCSSEESSVCVTWIIDYVYSNEESSVCVTWIIDYVCSSEESSVCVTWIIDYVCSSEEHTQFAWDRIIPKAWGLSTPMTALLHCIQRRTRALQQPTRFCGGGVVAVAGSFRYRSIKLPQFREIFLHFRETWRSSAIYGHSRKFRDTLQVCLHNSLQKENIYQKFGGGGAWPPWPPCPPPLATPLNLLFRKQKLS